MSAETIKEFLVGLGFKVHTNEQREFVDATTKAEGSLGKLKTMLEALTVGAAAYGAYKWLDNMTGGMEKLYYAAQRVGSSVGAIQAFGYAASQMGSSVEQAQAAAQGITQWMLRSPNAEANLRGNLGINTRDAGGKLLGGVELDQAVANAIKGMPDWRQNQIADMVGMPLELRMAMQSGDFQKMEGDSDAARKRAGLDPTRVAQDSHVFQTELRKIGLTMQVVGESITKSLIGDRGLGGALERFNAVLIQHTPQIAAIFGKFADAAVPAFAKLLDYLGTVDWNTVLSGLQNMIEWLITEVKAFGNSGILPKLANGNDAFWRHTFDTVGGLFGDEGAAHRALKSMGFSTKENHNGDFRGLPPNAAGAGHGAHVPLGFRNNNPGNLRYNAYTRGLGATGENGGFAVFPNVAAGLHAIDANLMSYFRKGVNTPYAIAHRWSKTDQEPYTKNLAGLFGGNALAHLLPTPAVIEAIRNAIIQQENGRNPYKSGYPRAGAGVKPGASTVGPGVTQTNHYNINGAGDPMAVANHVATKQVDANQRMVRNFRQVYA